MHHPIHNSSIEAKIKAMIMAQFPGSSMRTIQREIADLLRISPATVYNKINGRSNFSVDELFAIAKQYQLDINYLIHGESPVNITFNSDGFKATPEHYIDYINRLYDNVIMVKALSNKQAIYICNQPHLFYLLRYPYLFYLKLYSYNLINWKREQLYDFDPEPFVSSSEIYKKLNAMAEIYLSIPSIDLLSTEFISPICNQISYLVKKGVVTDKFYLKKIVSELNQFILKLEDTAILGRDRSQEMGLTIDRSMYVTDFINISNMILIEGNEGSLFTLQCDVPDVALTKHRSFISHMKKWIHQTIEYSTLISVSGGLDRKNYFDYLKNKVDQLNDLTI